MPRAARHVPGGFVYHALNRAVARLPLFQKDGDYEAFERVLALALEKHPTRLLAYCVMPNHWHMVLWPEQDGQLTAFLRWLTNTHTMRWHAHYHTSGRAICTRAVSSRSRSRPTITCTRCFATWSVIRSAPTWSSVPRSGAGRVCGGGARATRERDASLRNGLLKNRRIGLAA